MKCFISFSGFIFLFTFSHIATVSLFVKARRPHLHRSSKN